MRALVVDDSRSMRSVLRRYLSDMGYEVLEASQGVEALELLAQARPPVDVALIDWNMPVMDGFELVKAIRATTEYKNLAIIIVSSENDRGKIARALLAGADEYIMKPVTHEILASKLALLGSG